MSRRNAPKISSAERRCVQYELPRRHLADAVGVCAKREDVASTIVHPIRRVCSPIFVTVAIGIRSRSMGGPALKGGGRPGGCVLGAVARQPLVVWTNGAGVLACLVCPRRNPRPVPFGLRKTKIWSSPVHVPGPGSTRPSHQLVAPAAPLYAVAVFLSETVANQRLRVLICKFCHVNISAVPES